LLYKAVRTNSGARYGHEHKGHHGLREEAYTHFTAPMRRYIDILLHRIILAKQEGREIPYQDLRELEALAAKEKDCSRKTNKASRECDEVAQKEWYKAHVGKHFKGTIMDVSPRGLKVQLDEPPIVVSVKESALAETSGESNKSRYKLGKNGIELTNGNTHYRWGDQIELELKEYSTQRNSKKQQETTSVRFAPASQDEQ
ncbi:MAG: RNB domain-containing ribonuclease, partial [Myxococcota bacterium]